MFFLDRFYIEFYVGKSKLFSGSKVLAYAVLAKITLDKLNFI